MGDMKGLNVIIFFLLFSACSRLDYRAQDFAGNVRGSLSVLSESDQTCFQVTLQAVDFSSEQLAAQNWYFMINGQKHDRSVASDLTSQKKIAPYGFYHLGSGQVQTCLSIDEANEVQSLVLKSHDSPYGRGARLVFDSIEF